MGVIGRDHDCRTRRTNARIDHRTMHTSDREMPVAALEPERALGNRAQFGYHRRRHLRRRPPALATRFSALAAASAALQFLQARP